MAIATLLPNIGDSLPVNILIAQLITYFRGNKYPRAKALGAIGGGVHGGSIYLNANGEYERIK